VILITHDLGVVARMADRVVVMYAGKVVEEGTRDNIFYQPHHPYTLALQGAIPRLDTATGDALVAIPGSPPSPRDLPSGCPFHPRCAFRQPVCEEVYPSERSLDLDGAAHRVSCHVDLVKLRAEGVK
jgi:peptide/nickel transport system ATP-binding protein/oligopeptide transport system ATP-binding protein